MTAPMPFAAVAEVEMDEAVVTIAAHATATAQAFSVLIN